MRTFLIILLFAAVAQIVLASCGGSDDSVPTVTGAAARPTAELAPDSIAATQLAGEYDLDSVAAAAKFKGKTLDVNGTVISLGTNKSGVSYVDLRGTGNYDAGSVVQCVLTNTGTTALSQIGVMEDVTITGTVEGPGESVKDKEGQLSLFMSTGLDVIIGDCSVVQ